MAESPRAKTEFIGDLLRPHWTTLSWAFLAALGEAAANLAEPWPIKLVLDSVYAVSPFGNPCKVHYIARRRLPHPTTCDPPFGGDGDAGHRNRRSFLFLF